MRASFPARHAALILAIVAGFSHLGILHGDAPATGFLNDGGIHDIDGPSEDIWVSNSTTLNVQPGADIRSPILSPGIVAADPTVTINVFGGFVRGGDNLGVVGQHGGNGIEGSGTVRIFGGIVQGADATGPGTGVGGGGVFIVGGTVTVEGGQILGGDHFGGGLFGGFALALQGASGTISGGTLQGGSGDAPGAALRLDSGVTLDITGGSFRGRFDLYDGSVLNVYGTDLDYSGNRADLLTGVLSDGTPISVQVFPQPGAQINLIPALTPKTLAEQIVNLNLPAGIESSLTTTLLHAQTSLDRGQTHVAINQLYAFINHVRALAGKTIDTEDAEALIEQGQALIGRLSSHATLGPRPTKTR